MKILPMLMVAASILAVSCERHEFDGPDGTKQLHEHGHGAHDDHAEGEKHDEAH